MSYISRNLIKSRNTTTSERNSPRGRFDRRSQGAAMSCQSRTWSAHPFSPISFFGPVVGGTGTERWSRTTKRRTCHTTFSFPLAGEWPPEGSETTLGLFGGLVKACFEPDASSSRCSVEEEEVAGMLKIEWEGEGEPGGDARGPDEMVSNLRLRVVVENVGALECRLVDDRLSEEVEEGRRVVGTWGE